MAGILDGKIALITGAGSGIGRATARIFAREGARLVLADVVEAGGSETLRMIKEAGADGIFVKCDVANEADVEATVARAIAHFGRLDCAFNNAGIGGAGRLTHEYSLEEWNRVIAINLTGVWLCMRAEIVQMLKQKSGAIVNTSSIMGLTGAIRVPAYTAAKHGVAGLTKAAALEYARHGLRINAVCPAPIYTPMLMGAFEKRPDMEERYARSEPMKRIGQPEEVGEAVAWLCSDRASYVTGLPMPVDGGYMAQ
ncbi:MAG TPA: SDR family oxidoreductase [Candidatus Binataceae bacterium]|nr:SDR family oxidoreductase [Candidatus Binataceae bacterium]